MRGKSSKKLRRLATMLTQNNPADKNKVYKRLKKVHKSNKKEL